MPPSLSISFERVTRLHNLATIRGLPKYLLRLSLDVEPSDIGLAQHASSPNPIPPMRQFKRFLKTIEHPTTGHYTMVISSRHEERTSMMCAATIFMRAISKHTKSAATTPLPYMHSIYGGRHDRLRDEPKFREGVGNVSLLVLTNLAENSTREKIEKARDLMHIYSSVPRILVVSGCDPLEFCLDHLYIKPTRVLWLGRNAKDAPAKSVSI